MRTPGIGDASAGTDGPQTDSTGAQPKADAKGAQPAPTEPAASMREYSDMVQVFEPNQHVMPKLGDYLRELAARRTFIGELASGPVSVSLTAHRCREETWEQKAGA